MATLPSYLFRLVKYPNTSPKTLARVELESKIDRAAGRVVGNLSESVTIDGLMMRIQTYRASGSDREECRPLEGRCPLCHP